MAGLQARWLGGGGGGGVQGVGMNPLKFLMSAFLGVEKIKKCTQNNQKTVTSRLHG